MIAVPIIANDNIIESVNGILLISTDFEKLDLKFVHQFLSEESYWAEGISFEKVSKAASQSLNFGAYEDGKQIGYARIISDFTSIAYLGDVFVATSHRGKGIGKWLMEVIIAHPQLQGMRRWILGTKDAHGLYEKYGFKSLDEPHRWMQRNF